ncbi:hypothetical protein CF386_10060 [Paraphotobacterium marinum]|uniref:Protein kinase domain-containing protein n=1 Tax=Paraphotobacterium marinum TaxID=1755811 RepID=A0A220VGA0_9GAMM|nr:protein kinase [Paraphotobacterium marinum]ASK79395.1 hypothetical protein CF386_10060 [Paraphotobacterium marinum]
MEMTTSVNAQHYSKEKIIYKCNETKRAFYRVKLPQLGLYYGLKEIEINEFKEIKIIKNEIIALNRLPFGITAKCHQYWQEESKHFLLLDWIDGIPLNEYIHSNPSNRRDFANRIKIAEKIGCKIVELYRYAVIHRDLKPENIIIHCDQNKNVRDVSFIDFGLSNQKRHMEEGTAHYRSPEQEFVRYVSLTHSTDVFSFTQIIHYLLTGAPIELNLNFDCSNWDEMNIKLPKFIKQNVYQKLTNTLVKGLAFDVRKRINNVSSIVNILKEVSRELNRRR